MYKQISNLNFLFHSL